MHSKATREPMELKRHWHVFTVRVGDSLSLSLTTTTHDQITMITSLRLIVLKRTIVIVILIGFRNRIFNINLEYRMRIILIENDYYVLL